MATLTDRVSRWLRSPQARRLAAQAQRKAEELARDPKTRRRINEIRTRIQRKR